MTDLRFISSLFRQQVLAMSAYKVANAQGLIKLDAMENPYSWPQELNQQWLQTLSCCPLNRYPDPEAETLVACLRETQEIPDASGILLGNGSDEIIQLLHMAIPSGSTILSPEPGFVMYKQIALSLGLNYQGVSLQQDFSLNTELMLEHIENIQPQLIFIAYPNNPSGNLFASEDIIRVIEKAPGLVVIDEAYAPFAQASFIPQLQHFDNLLVMRTISKLGLAGLRLGFLLGQLDIIEQLNKIRLPYNINTLTQISAEFALKNADVFAQQTESICADREHLYNQLQKFEQLTAFPTAANFILFRCPANKASQIFEEIKQQGVLIKNMSAQGGLLQDCLRVTIGTADENQQFIKALTHSLQNLG